MNHKNAAVIVRILKKEYPDADCTLKYKSPIQLVVAVMLSAQSTDERVNIVTPALFKKYKSIKTFANAEQSELEDYIKSVGLYHNKAKSIIALAKDLKKRFNSQIPQTLAELESLPGIGRKSANVIQGELFGNGDGIAVDTHVTRLSNRLGFTKNKDPKKIEQDLLKIISSNDRVLITHLLINHGREVCKARKPNCNNCILEKYCPKLM